MYSGYYFFKPGVKKGGITIVYDNGNETSTGYHKVESAEQALLEALNYSGK